MGWLFQGVFMSDAVASALQFAVKGEDVPANMMQSAMGQVMQGEADERLLAALLTALRVKGEAVSEIVGAARAMIECAVKIPTHRQGLLDTCGTGGDGLSTFNISTAAALVAAAAGVPVAKHGNRSVSSSSGSADVLEALGVNVQLSPEHVGQCVEEIGIGFCFAPLCHGSMKHAMPVRKLLGFRTLFNLLGPLTNPAGAEFQLLGVSTKATAEKIAQALSQLSRKRAFVVCGAGHLDEVSLWGETTVYLIEEDRVTKETWTPQSFGLPECRAEDLQVHSAAESATVIREIFQGKPGPARDIVSANASAALFAAEKVNSLEEGVALAHDALDEDRATDLLEQLIRFSNAIS
jgi:anthranilate phosphoribosyltransferase